MYDFDFWIFDRNWFWIWVVFGFCFAFFGFLLSFGLIVGKRRWLDLKTKLDFFEQVGKGLSIDAKAQKLAFQHWIEAVSSLNFIEF